MMNKIGCILFGVLLIFCISNCNDGQQQSQEQIPLDTAQHDTGKTNVGKSQPSEHGVEGFFLGDHSLTLINSITKESYDTGFVCLSDTGKSGTVRFYFKQGEGFLNALLPQEKIRFALLPETSNHIPFCKFRWSPSDFKEAEWTNNVIYAILYIKSSQMYRRK